MNFVRKSPSPRQLDFSDPKLILKNRAKYPVGYRTGAFPLLPGVHTLGSFLAGATGTGQDTMMGMPPVDRGVSHFRSSSWL